MNTKVVGIISPSEPWGLSTAVQNLNEYLGQTAINALNDLHVQIWTTTDQTELAELAAILTGLQTKVLISLATVDAFQTDLQRTS